MKNGFPSRADFAQMVNDATVEKRLIEKQQAEARAKAEAESRGMFRLVG